MWKVATPFLILACSACADLCRNDVQRTAEAPGGEHAAILFQRDCGATTGYSTQIAVVETEGAPTDADTVFVADTNRGAAEAATWGGPRAEVTWLSPDRLLVRHDARARIFRQKSGASGVHVIFEKLAD